MCRLINWYLVRMYQFKIKSTTETSLQKMNVLYTLYK